MHQVQRRPWQMVREMMHFMTNAHGPLVIINQTAFCPSRNAAAVALISALRTRLQLWLRFPFDKLFPAGRLTTELQNVGFPVAVSVHY